ncbi:hypothetical protein Ndes2526B_g06035 [Nannochloris sp. 'desiccata']
MACTAPCAKPLAPHFFRGAAVVPRHPRINQRMNLSAKQRQCVASSSQTLPIPGMPHAEYQKIASMKQVSQTEATTTGRKIVFAVDGTTGAEEGLKWIVKHVARKGDTVHLANVICDPRTPSTAVGSSEVATQWSPNRDEAIFQREFLLRMEHEAQSMMASRFIPSVQFSGVDHQVDLLRLKVHKSAAGIGEVLSNRAVDIKADLMVIASHGAGVLADYGSVARWCSENSPVPTLLLPPAILVPSTPCISKPTIVVAAVDDIQSLKKSFDFALQKLSRPGDSVYTMLVKPILNEEADLITEAASDSSVVPEAIPDGSSRSVLSPAGQLICAYAEELGARAVVLHHHGRSMMQDMMYGPVTLQVTKHCPRPLVILRASNQQQHQ